MHRPEPPITRRLVLNESGFEFVEERPTANAVASVGENAEKELPKQGPKPEEKEGVETNTD